MDIFGSGYCQTLFPMDDREELVLPNNLTPDEVILEDLSVLQTQNGPMTRSLVRRTYDDGKPGIFLMGLPKQFCFGLSKKYDYQADRTLDNWKGEYQISYSVTSLKTMKNPTPEEQAVFDACEVLEKKLAEYVYKNREQLGGIYEAVQSPEEVRRLKLVKSILSMPKMDDPKDKSTGPKRKKIFNPEKTYSLYLNVMRNKKRNVFTSRLFGPGDVQIVPLNKIEETTGDLEPIVFVSHVHFGAKASYQLMLWEGTFTPRESFGPRRRLIGKNADVPREVGPAREEDDGDDEIPREDRVIAGRSATKPSERSDPVADLGSGSEGDGKESAEEEQGSKPIVVTKKPPAEPPAKKKMIKKKVRTQEEDAE